MPECMKSMVEGPQGTRACLLCYLMVEGRRAGVGRAGNPLGPALTDSHRDASVHTQGQIGPLHWELHFQPTDFRGHI